MTYHRLSTPALVAALALASCSTPPPKGDVTIVTQIDFHNEPFRGTFEVTEGSDILGCDRGSFVDTPTASSILKQLSCESGERAGTFTVDFLPQDIPGLGDQNGSWTIKQATGDFSDLTGGGDFWIIYSEDGYSGTETLAGMVDYAP